MSATGGTTERIDYVGAWRRELRAGKRTPLTLDNLWSAACRQLQAEEAERLLAFALDHGAVAGKREDTGLTRDVGIAGLLDAVEHDWERAHAAMIGPTRDSDRVAA